MRKLGYLCLCIGCLILFISCSDANSTENTVTPNIMPTASSIDPALPEATVTFSSTPTSELPEDPIDSNLLSFSRGKIEHVAISPEGLLIAVATPSGVDILGLEDGELVNHIPLEGTSTDGLTWAEDDKIYVARRIPHPPEVSQRRISLVDINDGSTIESAVTERIRSPSLFSPDGSVYLIQENSTLLLTEPISQKEIATINYEGALSDIVWSPDSSLLGGVFTDGHATIWESTSGEELDTLDIDQSLVTMCINDTSIAYATSDNNITLYEFDTQVIQWQLTLETPPLYDMKCGTEAVYVRSENGLTSFAINDGTFSNTVETLGYRLVASDTVISWYDDGLTHYSSALTQDWDNTNYNGFVQDSTFSDNGKFVAIATNFTTRIWRVDDMKLVANLTWAGPLAWETESTRIAIADGKNIHIWDAESARPVRQIEHNYANINALDWLTTGEIAFGGVKEYGPDYSFNNPDIVAGGISVLEPETDSIIWEQTIPDLDVSSLSSSPLGNYLLYGKSRLYESFKVTLIDAQTGEAIGNDISIPENKSFYTFSWSPNEDLFLVANSVDTIIYRSSDMMQVASFDTPDSLENLNYFHWSPNTEDISTIHSKGNKPTYTLTRLIYSAETGDLINMEDLFETQHTLVVQTSNNTTDLFLLLDESGILSLWLDR